MIHARARFAAPHHGAHRRFLFLQGPHGPFFWQLAQHLEQSGAACWRVGFNAGDRRFWGRRQSYIAYRDSAEDWPATLARLFETKRITDLVLYGEARPIHAGALAVARRYGLRTHIFEEGYLRPYWITYERHGSNGHSPVLEIPLTRMRKVFREDDPPPAATPASWGDLRQHVFYGALYHFHVMALNRAYPAFRPHRDLPVGAEFALYLKRLMSLPVTMTRRAVQSARIRNGGFPFHLALLQLAHDASFRSHSPYRSQREVIDEIVDGFANGAPGHHRLVFKAHPLEDGRAPLSRLIAQRARQRGIAGRVHFLPGGKLAALLNETESVVTVNSTAAQQALWRGLPVKALGTAVYSRPEFVSQQSLPAFFADPQPPDTEAYALFRRFLLETSQVPGGYYSAAGRRRLLRRITDRMLSSRDPYAGVLPQGDGARAALRVVK